MTKGWWRVDCEKTGDHDGHFWMSCSSPKWWVWTSLSSLHQWVMRRLGQWKEMAWFLIHLDQLVIVCDCDSSSVDDLPATSFWLEIFLPLSHHLSIPTGVILTRKFRNVPVFWSAGWECLNMKSNLHKKKHHLSCRKIWNTPTWM